MAEYNADETVRQAYTYGAAGTGGDGRIGVDKFDETSYYLYDGRGSVTGVLAERGVLTNSYRYDSYGDLVSGTPDAVNYYGYNAESTNVKTGFQYLRSRYYDPETGAFTSEDTETGTKENPLTRNRYIYVLDNPLNYCDPKGTSLGSLWNSAKNAVSKAANWVNNHVIKPAVNAVKKYVVEPVKKAVNWVKDTASVIYNKASNWWNGVVSNAGGYSVIGESFVSAQNSVTGNYGPTMQQIAEQMSDTEIGQLPSGYGLYGEQLERYKEQRTLVVFNAMKRVVCSNEKARLSDYAVMTGTMAKEIIKYKLNYDLDSLKNFLPRIEINYTGTAKDWMQLGVGVGEMALGTFGLLGSGALEAVTAGGATPVAAGTAGASVVAVGSGALTVTVALGNLVDVNVYKSQGNSSGGSAAQSIEDILEDAEETTNNSGVARNFEKTGGYEKTLEDFNALRPANVKEIQTQYGLGKVGYLEDGTSVVARPGSKTGGATLEIRVSNSKIYKIRY